MMVKTTREIGLLHDDDNRIVLVSDDNVDDGNVFFEVRKGQARDAEELLSMWLDPRQCREIAAALTEAADAVEALVPAA